jgi:hypothetical protein
MREDRQYSRRGTEDENRLAGEFNNPRDAERWDRFQESQAAETGPMDKPSNRAYIPIDPRERDLRDSAYEDWYREPRGTEGVARYPGDFQKPRIRDDKVWDSVRGVRDAEPEKKQVGIRAAKVSLYFVNCKGRCATNAEMRSWNPI